MTRRLDQIYADILEHPERDDLRLEYADVCALSDPERADYIRKELVGEQGDPRVARQIMSPLLRYSQKTPFGLVGLKISRGFIEHITTDPQTFIEHGATICQLAPIRHVTFLPRPPANESQEPRWGLSSPLPALMQCPHLANLHTIQLVGWTGSFWLLEPADIEHVLTSPNLGRMLCMRFPRISATSLFRDPAYLEGLWRRIFSLPTFRKMLTIGLPYDYDQWPGEGLVNTESPNGPGGLRFTPDGNSDWFVISTTTPMPPAGRAIEREYGYIPTLHRHNKVQATDGKPLDYFELTLKWQRGELPLHPVGSPVTEEIYAELPPPYFQ